MIKLFSVHMPPEADDAVRATLHSGYIGQGPRVDEFEALLAQRLSNPHLAAVNSCTAALQLALRLSHVNESGRNKVVTTPMTCSATTSAILAAGGQPVWADVDPMTGLVDPTDVRARLSDDCAAIVCVDWGGHPCELDALRDICAAEGVALIEDAAHALGATYKGRPIGNDTATYTCFSFQAIKLITTGDGGVIACGSEYEADRARRLRWFGIDRQTESDFKGEQDIASWGYKFQMNDIAASIGVQQVPYVDGLLQRHREHAEYYLRTLDTSYFHLPRAAEHTCPSYWLFTLLLPSAADRLAFIAYLASHGVQASAVHRRNDLITAFTSFRAVGLDGVEFFDARQVNIPVHAGLTRDEVAQVADVCNQFAAMQQGSRGA